MKKYILVSAFLLFYSLSAQVENNLSFYGKDHFLLEGTIVPDSLKESPYDRLPISYKERVRKPIWDLSKSSSGLSIRFVTNTSMLKVKWHVLNNFDRN